MPRMFKPFLFALALTLLLGGSCSIGFADKAKNRVPVLTDITIEPDDVQSLVRFLTYADHFYFEGLVATKSIHQKKNATGRIRQIVRAYGKVQPNLLLHEPALSHG